MNAFFGIPMQSIMLVLLVLLAVCFLVIAWVVLRNRIVFLMGLRNIPRRVAQTVLIVVGLMLSTLIISAAFTTGDTVDHSITKLAYDRLGHVDVLLEPKATGAGFLPAARRLSQDQYQTLINALDEEAHPQIDGYMGLLFEEVPVVNLDARLSEPSVNLAGLDAARLDGFPDVISAATGEVLDVRSLGVNEAFMNESAARDLRVDPGDTVQVYVRNQPHEFLIVDVVEDKVLTGVAREDSQKGMVTALDNVHAIFGHENVSYVVISVAGGVRDTLPFIEGIENDLLSLVQARGLSLDTGMSKLEAVETAEEFGNFMTTFFLLMGLFSIGAGMLLIVMIFVMLAAERKSEMGMARAVGMKGNHLIQMFISEGMAYNVFAAMVGAALGIGVAFILAYLLSMIFSEFGISISPRVTLRTILISYSLGVVLTFATVAFASWRASNLNIVRAIREIPDPPGGRMGWRGRAFWASMVVLGVLLVWLGMDVGQAFPFALGFSMATGGVAVWLRFFGMPDRPVYTTMGLLLILFWGLTAGDRLEWLFGELEGDVEMFFLSGVAMVTASTFVLIYNADIVLALLSRLGGVFGSILPAMRTAVAYPLNNRFRTGMTMAMISLVVFALTMMSTMNLNFERLFLTDEARGGWDIRVQENANNPLPDLPAALESAGSGVAEEFRAVGRLDLPGQFFSDSQIRSLPADDFNFLEYPVRGVSDAFVEGGDIPFDSRAAGYESDEEVWRALRTRDDVIVIDGFLAEPGGFGPGSVSLRGVNIRDDVFDAVPLEIRDPVSGNSKEVELIGVLTFGASSNFMGAYVNERAFQEVYGEPEISLHFIALNNPDRDREVAQEVESTLFAVGAQAESLKALADQEQALFRNFLYLMQAFMGLGLFVGIAAVGVIAFRTVVERRQQIGMLRAIGYKRSTVALSFMMESSFVTLLGILSGIGLAIWLSYFLITSDEFPTSEASYYVPWVQITVVGVFTFLASLVMTFIPSRQAASIPTAEALRYE